MFKRLALISAVLVLSGHPLLSATSRSELEKEYQQVRTIALRDAKVRAAYQDADRRLDEKIVQLDPALKPYVAANPTGKIPTPTAMAASQRTNPKEEKSHAAPAAAAAKRTPVSESKTPTSGPAKTHVVEKGETLGSIASKHGVKTEALQEANQIKDPRKLRVGQTLTIPAAGTKATAKAPAAKAPAKVSTAPKPETKEEGFWARLKKTF